MMIFQKDWELERLSESWRFSTTASEQQASRSVGGDHDHDHDSKRAPDEDGEDGEDDKVGED